MTQRSESAVAVERATFSKNQKKERYNTDCFSNYNNYIINIDRYSNKYNNRKFTD